MRNTLAFCLVVVATLGDSWLSELPAQEPEKTDVFVAGENGVSLYRIPGTVVTPHGTVLAYCEARKNSRSDWGEIEVHLKRSIDGGKSWLKAEKIAH